MKYYGDSYFRKYIDDRYDLASRFAAIIRSDREMELAVQPDSNIVCFRYTPKASDNSTLNRINSIIREKIIKEGSFYIVQTELSGIIWLRITIINPATSLENLNNLIKRIKETGKKELFL